MSGCIKRNAIVDDPLTPVLLPLRLHSQQPSLLIHQASLGRGSHLSCYLSSHLSNYIANNPLPPVLPPLRLHVNNPLPLVLPTFSLTPPTTPLPPVLSPLQLRSHPLPITYPTTLLPSPPITITHPLPLVPHICPLTNYSNYIVNNPLPYLFSLLSALHRQKPSPTCPPTCLLTYNPPPSPTCPSHPSRLQVVHNPLS